MYRDLVTGCAAGKVGMLLVGLASAELCVQSGAVPVYAAACAVLTHASGLAVAPDAMGTGLNGKGGL